ncbi:hypothetical protein B0H11DRAFT_158919 [Mycena galericulata]|nr:hypothetical protein B0H11DRAFT_158919 [Mycena galericulata]
MSTALWSVLLVPQYPIMSEVLAFIAVYDPLHSVILLLTITAGERHLQGRQQGSLEHGTLLPAAAAPYLNLTQMLEFCRTVNPTLQDYEADGAWPTLLDDFVAWKKESLGNGAVAAE